MDPPEDDLAARLAAIHEQLDYPPGIRFGVFRLPILDQMLDELEAAVDGQGPAGAPPLSRMVVAELERLAELLSSEMLATVPEALQRRVRIVELVRRSTGGGLPALAADPSDPFGAELRGMLESDADLRLALGQLHPLVARATSVAPSARWIRDARALVEAGPAAGTLVDATRRVLAALVRSEVVSRPDLLIGGVRLPNQRLARGLLWLASVALDSPAETLGAVGLRMGTSGRSDAVVRDTALANTAAALLGASSDEGAPAALASMRLEITNRNVLKQVDRALEAQAARAGQTVDELIDVSLPRFGLDAGDRLEIEGDDARAVVDVGSDGRVGVTWHGPGGITTSAPAAVERDAPALVAEVGATVARIEAALAEELRRFERRLASERTWPLARWRARFGDHPIARVHARTMLWTIGSGSARRVGLASGEGWLGVDERPLDVGDAATIQLWHPADARPGEVEAWRATLAVRAVAQAVRQADREVFARDASSSSPVADLRHAGAIVDHRRLRALLRQKGWAVPALGAWDQGDEATAWRAFDDGLRAELRYQSPERVPTGEPVEHARIIAVRFVRTDAPAVSPAVEPVRVAVADVPARVFSEALRDVSLVVAA